MDCIYVWLNLDDDEFLQDTVNYMHSHTPSILLSSLMIELLLSPSLSYNIYLLLIIGEQIQSLINTKTFTLLLWISDHLIFFKFEWFELRLAWFVSYWIPRVCAVAGGHSFEHAPPLTTVKLNPVTRGNLYA